MKQNIIQKTSLALACTMMLSLSLTACGNKADSSSEAASSTVTSTGTESTDSPIASFGAAADFDYLNFKYDQNLTTDGLWQDITATDYVTLPDDFANVTVPTADVTPTDESIQYQLDQLITSFATTDDVTDRPAQEGDTAYIDYSGSVGGVKFNGGTAENQPLVLGSGRFIAGFEEAIVGHQIGETFDIEVTFPEGYNDSTDADGNAIVLSGAQATFSITLNSLTVTNTPELTDEWVQKTLYASNGLTTVDGLTEDITHQLFLQNIDIYVWNYLAENSTFESIPGEIINYQVCLFLGYYDAQAYQYNVDLETFVTNMIGLESVDAFLMMQEETILDQAKMMVMQQAVAEQLDLAVTDELMEGYAEYLETMPEGYVALNALSQLVDQTLVDGVVMS